MMSTNNDEPFQLSFENGAKSNKAGAMLSRYY